MGVNLKKFQMYRKLAPLTQKGCLLEGISVECAAGRALERALRLLLPV